MQGDFWASNARTGKDTKPHGMAERLCKCSLITNKRAGGIPTEKELVGRSEETQPFHTGNTRFLRIMMVVTETDQQGDIPFMFLKK